MTIDLAKNDPVVAPDGRPGIIISSRGEDRTVVGFEDGTSEQIPRSLLRPAMKAELPDRSRIEAAHGARTAPRQRRASSAKVVLPSGEEATVIGRAGRAGVRVRLADGSETQVHRNVLMEGNSVSTKDGRRRLFVK